jgi:hypothetical protein
MSQQRNSDGLEVLFDFLRDTPERQMDNSTSHDNKIVNIFSAASVVIGLAGLSSGSLAPSDWSVTALLILGLGAYVVTAYIAFRGLRPRQFRRSLQPQFWTRSLWGMGADDVRHSILTDVGKAYANNKPLLAAKAASIRMALLATGAEVVFVGLALISACAG